MCLYMYLFLFQRFLFRVPVVRFACADLKSVAEKSCSYEPYKRVRQKAMTTFKYSTKEYISELINAYFCCLI